MSQTIRDYLESIISMTDHFHMPVDAAGRQLIKIRQTARAALQQLDRDNPPEDTEPPICSSCNGSGEGQHERTTCRRCRGRGVIYPE
jgi:DnaJ-class molecular chaperone